jgi:hypothetical protein
MGEAWAVGGTAAIATVKVIAVPHSGSRRTSATKRGSAHRAVGSRIIRATSCACPICQGESGAAPPLTGSCRRHANESLRHLHCTGVEHMTTEHHPRATGWYRSRTSLALLAFLAIAAFFLVTEHRAHA